MAERMKPPTRGKQMETDHPHAATCETQFEEIAKKSEPPCVENRTCTGGVHPGGILQLALSLAYERPAKKRRKQVS